MILALSTYVLLAIVGVWSAQGPAGWAYALFAFPALLAVPGFAAAGYRLYRSPHLGHHARTPA